MNRLVVVLVLGALALAAGVMLARAFWAEREDATRWVAEERRLIEDAASRTLAEHLEERLRDAEPRIERALDDALMSDSDLIVFEKGEQVLPHWARYAAWDVNIEVPKELAELADDVIRASSDAELEKAVRSFLAWRARHRISAAADAEVSLRVARHLATKSIDASLARALVIAGRNVGAERIEPIASQLLRARSRGQLSRAQGEALFTSLMTVCRDFAVDCARFDERWRTQIDPISIAGLREARAPMIFPGPVYVEPRPGAVVYGLWLGDAAIDAAVDAALRSRGLLADDDRIRFTVPPEGVSPRQALAELASPRLEQRLRTARARFTAKGALLGAAAALAAALLGAVMIDQRRRARYQALRSDFVSAVSHELRTPLASMRLLVETLARNGADDRQRPKLERLLADVDGLDFLVENILSFSRLERGRIEPRKERVSLLELCADVAEQARRDCPGLEVEVRGADIDAHADPELLRLVISNLARNAWSHNPAEKKRVDLVVDENGVSISDNGAGIADADRERVFLPFERASTSSRGSGLGLALARQIARAHGGDVTLASTGPTGTKFVVTLGNEHGRARPHPSR